MGGKNTVKTQTRSPGEDERQATCCTRSTSSTKIFLLSWREYGLRDFSLPSRTTTLWIHSWPWLYEGLYQQTSWPLYPSSDFNKPHQLLSGWDMRPGKLEQEWYEHREVPKGQFRSKSTQRHEAWPSWVELEMMEDVPETFALKANWLFQDKGSQMTQIYTSQRYVRPHKPTELIFCSFRSADFRKVGSHPEVTSLSILNTLNSKLPIIRHPKRQQKKYICFVPLLSALLKEKKNLKRVWAFLLHFNTIFGTAESRHV